MPTDISTYLAQYAHELGHRILQLYPPLHSVDDPVSPLLGRLLRKPFKAQAAAVTSIVKKFRESRAAAVVAECGAGKTLIALASIWVHSGGGNTTTLYLCPPHLTHKSRKGRFLDATPSARILHRGHSRSK